MSELKTNLSFKSIYHKQTLLNSPLCNQDFCYRIMKIDPKQNFDKLFLTSLKENKEHGKPIFVLENPFYLSMIEKLKALKPQGYCDEWVLRHADLKHGTDLGKNPIDCYFIDGQDKKDYIKFFTRFKERFLNGDGLFEQFTNFINKKLADDDPIELDIENLLGKNDCYQSSFANFLQPKGFTIDDPYRFEEPITLGELLGVTSHVQ